MIGMGGVNVNSRGQSFISRLNKYYFPKETEIDLNIRKKNG